MSRDAFLGGRLHLHQPDHGFRSGSDAVLLAACVPARAGETLLDLGCGAGAAMYCVAARVSGVAATGVERDSEAAALARRNGDADVVEADVLDLPPALRGQWAHVIANPPYYTAGAGSPAPEPSREAGLREAAPGDVARWAEVACRRVAPKGSVSLIVRADRLAEVLGPMDAALGALAVLPIAPHPGAAANRVIVQGVKNRAAPLRLLPPLVTHPGPKSGAYTPEVETILRDVGALWLR